MRRWLRLRSDPNAQTRPPWIQKVVIPDPPQEVEWQSLLAEKLRTLRGQNGLNPEKDATGTENIAFHVAPPTFSGPADSSIPAPAKDGAISHPQEIASAGDKQISQAPEDKAHGTASTPKGAYYSQESMSLQYCWENEPEPTKLPYEFGYSTLDYGQKDEFDLDTLFDSPTFMPEAAWSVPQEAVAEITETEPLRECTKSGRLADDTPQPTTPSPTHSPTIAQCSEQKTKKIEKNSPQTWERASVTPIVVLNRQQELRFPMLKTQPRAFEVSNPAETQAVIAKLEETLEQFSIEGHVVGIQRGPIVTRYELKMAAGIKVSRILALTDELAMALEALRVRIEAPIPGRSTVGIEIPNKQRVKVLLGDILGDPGFREFGGALPLPLGRDIAGNLLVEDLTRMPHLLIAGATGSGKSVAINSFISSLILTKSPEEVRFLLIDPKLVELSAYNDIPHLLHPVITEPNKAILALNWAVEEMERRYEDLAELGARDIRSYNDKLRQQRHKIDLPTMPYIVVLIDELGDLMMVAGKEVESSIIRLAQKARAVGIHLILATQRPSVDVITALIKANCPARIALQVAQKTDSRTILDSNGAEQLLGQGDMLFRHPARAQLIRAQAPLIEDEEVESVVAWAQKLAKPVYITLEDPKGKLGELEDGDEELLAEAWQIIIESQKASASYLQRRMRIGYNKAARLIEAFEARGLVGPQIGSKPREIYGNAQSLSR